MDNDLVTDDCWKSLNSGFVKEFNVAKYLFLTFIALLLPLITAYIVPEFGNIKIYREHTVAGILTMVELALFFSALFLAMTFYQNEMKETPKLINCLKAYYTSVKDTHFEDFQWLVDAGLALEIEYAMAHWLILPDADGLKMITPCHSKYQNTHIGYVLTDTKTRETIMIDGTPKNIDGPIFTFIKCVPPADVNSSSPCRDVERYMGKWYLCLDEECRKLVKEIIKGLAMHGKKIKGISVQGISEGTYLGIFTRYPKNSMEFEELLSYADNLRTTFECHSS
ncbi:MAG: hypothetical protein GXO25_08100 [Euryarchaeota archaeon]|nr:hypothetical protein [Euryarchaeota archaeon]